MDKINAFVGHSFEDQDKEVVDQILGYLNSIKRSLPNFDWENAKPSQASPISQKVKELILDKNLFIGIFTRKELAIAESKLKIGLLKYKIGLEKDFEWKTSDWVLQELGYCLGRDMKVIILLEEGVRKVSGLHADLEYIVFNRTNTEQCLQKLLEQISAISSDSNLAIDKSATSINADEGEEVESDATLIPNTENLNEDFYSTPNADWKYSDYWVALYYAVDKNDATKELEIFNGGMSITKNAEDVASWNADYLYLKGIIRHELVSKQIEEISKENPGCSKVKLTLARLYSKFGSNDKAISNALEAEEIENSYMSTSLLTAIEHIKNEHGEEAALKHLFIHREKYKNDNIDQNIQFLTAYANLIKKSDNQLYYSLIEAILNLKPEDKLNRFQLAFAYSEKNLHSFSAYHYKILCDSSNDDSNYFNNLAVAYENLGLPIESVEYYKKAIELKSTLAMSNLATRYLTGGFVESSQNLCNEALQHSNYDKRVLTAISSINQRLDYEKETLDAIAESTKNHRSFYTNFGLSMNYDQLDLEVGAFIRKGTFCSVGGDFNISVSGNQFRAVGIFKRIPTDATPKTGLRTLLSLDPVHENYTTTIVGFVTGCTIRAKIERVANDEISSTPSPKKAEALIYFDKNKKQYEVAEIGENNIIDKIYQLSQTVF